MLDVTMESAHSVRAGASQTGTDPREKAENGPDTSPSSSKTSSKDGEEMWQDTPIDTPVPQKKMNRMKDLYLGWRSIFAYEGNKDAMAFALDAIPRGVVSLGSAVFLSGALLHLAREAAGCETEPPPGESKVPECNERIYGIRPSSLLTLYITIVGVLASLLMPILGAALDHSHYRRGVGRAAVTFITLTVLVEGFVSEKTWFPIAILQVVLAFVSFCHISIVYAYLPEITQDKDKLIKYTAGFNMINNLSMVFFLLAIIGIAMVSGLSSDPVATARLSQLSAAAISFVCFGFAWWKLFSARSATQQLPAGQSVVSMPFKHVYSTGKKIVSNKSLVSVKWFLLSHALSNAASFALSATAVTYLTDQLQFESTELGIVVLIMMVSSIPGSKLSINLGQAINPKRSLLLCLVVMIVNTAAMAAVLVDPSTKPAAYGFAVVLGITLGWKFPTEKYLYCNIIPKNQDAELMGIHVFSSQMLMWLPPLVVTALNEAGYGLRIGIFILTVFKAFALVCVLFMGSYYEAEERVKDLDVTQQSELSTQVSSKGGGSDEEQFEDNV